MSSYFLFGQNVVNLKDANDGLVVNSYFKF